jgi:hypothetical protein
MLLIVTPQNLHQSLVDYFYLWMECCKSLQLTLHLLPKCSPKGTKKSYIPISDDSPWYLKVHPDLFKEHVYCILSFDGLFTRHKNAHLAKPINYHK